jgi:Mrp family chromosome partitioning ATPase
VSEIIHAVGAGAIPGRAPERVEPDLDAPALIDSAGIRTIAERVAAVARLGSPARLLIAGCRKGDGASSVAVALALDLSRRLGVDTLLVDADPAGNGRGAAPVQEAKAGNGRPVRVHPTSVAHLWVARCAPANGKTRPATPARLLEDADDEPQHDDVVDELEEIVGRYPATVVDLGVVHLDARMAAIARPEDPVLLVVRCGSTRRDELAATAAILNLAKCKIGGVILNAYQTPAADWLRRFLGLRDQNR